MTSEIVRNVLMLQCVYYASVFNELVLYKHTFPNQDSPKKDAEVSMADLRAEAELPDYKVGIIGCGQVGTSLLTKLLEVKDQLHNLKLIVSSRQPHLLRPFKQEFGVEVLFDNAKVAAECDIIFVCVLPSQAPEVFKDIRDVIKERAELSKKDKT
jgi:glutamyl-tRNA reductase